MLSLIGALWIYCVKSEVDECFEFIVCKVPICIQMELVLHTKYTHFALYKPLMTKASSRHGVSGVLRVFESSVGLLHPVWNLTCGLPPFIPFVSWVTVHAWIMP